MPESNRMESVKMSKKRYAFVLETTDDGKKWVAHEQLKADCRNVPKPMLRRASKVARSKVRVRIRRSGPGGFGTIMFEAKR